MLNKFKNSLTFSKPPINVFSFLFSKFVYLAVPEILHEYERNVLHQRPHLVTVTLRSSSGMLKWVNALVIIIFFMAVYLYSNLNNWFKQQTRAGQEGMFKHHNNAEEFCAYLYFYDFSMCFVFFFTLKMVFVINIFIRM